MKKRQNISKKIRFEVFKRDKFTCQYCGRKAPDVELEIDHLIPVAKGGDNNILNLITSCWECNNGKRDKKLDDNSLIEMQRKELEELQDRKNRLNMILDWSMELEKIEKDEVDTITTYIKSTFSEVDFEDKFIEIEFNKLPKIKSLIKKYGIDELVEAIKISKDSYYMKYIGSNSPETCFAISLQMIPRILAVRKQSKTDPHIEYKLKAKSYARKKFGAISEEFDAMCDSYLTHPDILDFFISVLRKHDNLEDAENELEDTFIEWDLEIYRYEQSLKEQNGNKENS